MAHEPGHPPEDSNPDEANKAYPESDKQQKDLRVREQCYLVRNLHRFARSRMLGYEANINPDGTSTARGSKTYKTANAAVSPTFKNLILSNADPGHVVSSLAGTLDSASLLNIPSNVLSRLVPHIQIYKVYYDLATGTSGKRTILSENGAAISLPFSNNYSPKIAQDILKNRASQGEGIGLKSVNVKFLGTNPAEVKTMLEVNMKIFCRDFGELLKVRNVQKSKNGESHTAAFSDLITRDPTSKYENNRTYKDEVFRIRLVVGWSVPQGSAAGIFDGIKNKKAILSTLHQSKMVITCALATHSLNFNQDGSLELEVKYTGRLETEFRNNRKTIFNYRKRVLSDTKAIVKQAREALKKQRAVKDKQPWYKDVADFAVDYSSVGDKGWQLVGLDKNPFTGGGLGSDTAAAELQLEQAIQQAENLKNEELGRAYKDFLNGFFAEKKHSLFWLSVPPHIYRQSLDPRVPRPEFGGATVLVERMGNPPAGSGHNPATVDSDSAAKAENKDVTVYQLHGFGDGDSRDKRGDVWASNVLGGDGKMKKAVDDAFALLSDDEGGSYEEAINKLNQNLSDISDDRYENDDDGEPTPSPEGEVDNYNLYFTYMGDLLDYAMNTVKDPKINQTAENLRILMGAFTYVDPLTYEHIRVNITDIPISLNSFINWMFQRYVRREKLDVTAFDFLKDIVQDLGVKYLGGTCFSAGSVPSTRTRFGSNMTLTVPRHKGKSLLPEGPLSGLSKKQLDNIALIKQDPSIINLPPEDMDHVCYIYVTNALPTDKRGHEKTDAESGIFHFRLGADRGVLKKAKYKRMDQPYLQEARIIENDKIDDSPSNPEARESNATLRLKEVYNCDIEMYGNTIFYPGMVFYIDPSKMGIEGGGITKLVLAENLGIKGYYHVNKVEHIYESGKYETLLEGIFLTDGNNRFYKDKVQNQSGRLNRMMSVLTSPSTEAAQKYLDAFVLQSAAGDEPGSDSHLQTSSEDLAAIEAEFNDEMSK